MSDWDELVQEAKANLPAELEGLLRQAKDRCIVAMKAADWFGFSLDWGNGEDGEYDLTVEQAEAIWAKWGFQRGSAISLRTSPGDTPGTWKLHCDRSERKVWDSELMEVLFPDAGRLEAR